MVASVALSKCQISFLILCVWKAIVTDDFLVATLAECTGAKRDSILQRTTRVETTKFTAMLATTSSSGQKVRLPVFFCEHCGIFLCFTRI